MGAKKLERSAAEVFLEAAIREGRATEQELAIGSIVVDKALQSRVETNMEYVKHLADLIAMGVRLRAVVVFRDPKAGRLILADGFHRVAATKRSQPPGGPLPPVRAWVMEGTREDAVMYSVSANLENSKPTTREDREKAVRMLLATEAGRKMSLTEIGRRCGIASMTVARYRTAYFSEKGWALPEEIEYLVGGKVVKQPARRLRERPPKYYPKPTTGNRKGSAYLIDGKGARRYLGRDDAGTRAKFEVLAAEEIERQKDIRICLNTNSNLSSWLVRRGVAVEGIRPSADRSIAGGILHPAFVANVAPDLTTDSLYRAWGHIRALRLSVNPELRAIVVCYPPDNLRDLIDLARKDDVLFLTPEEVVGQFGGKAEGTE